jgi:hypothetical protein
MTRYLRIATASLVVALACSGCGSDGSDSTARSSSTKSIDGILQVEDGAVTIAGPDGKPLELTTGSKTRTPAAELRALEAADEPVHATYSGGSLVEAASVSDLVADLPSVTGQITSVSDEAVDLDTKDGAVHLVIDEDDLGAMDPEHLREHQAEHEDTVIHYEDADGVKHAKGFADAD